MKRFEIMNKIPVLDDDEETELIHEYMKDIIDHFESKFNEIAELINISDISEIDNINRAYEIAKIAGDSLY